MSKKRAIRIILMISWLALLFIVVTNIFVFATGSNSYYEVYQISNQEYAIVLGSKVSKKQLPFKMLKDRLDTVIKLYNRNKVKKILLSGDDRPANKEVSVMKRYLLKKGVPKETIIIDRKAYSTFQSVSRAKKVFKIKQAVLVSQKFHLSRTLFVAKAIGIDAQGLAADRQAYGWFLYYYMAREYLANIAAIGQVLLD